MYQPDEYIQKALKTWYPVDNDLHLNPLHPVIKLAGEAGEILDLYGKHKFKPGFDWWNCKHCGEVKARHQYTIERVSLCKWQEKNVYTPLVLDELGDWWYYCRILMYMSELNIDKYPVLKSKDDILTMLSKMNLVSSLLLDSWNDYNNLDVGFLKKAYSYFLGILGHLDVTLDDLTEMNYIKLNSDATNHGWKNAGIK